MSDESSSDDEGSNMLGGFMFGNIDKEGQLENNIFGDVTRHQLNQLNSACGVESLVSDLNQEEKQSVKPCDNSTTHHKDAVDFYDTNDDLIQEETSDAKDNVRGSTSKFLKPLVPKPKIKNDLEQHSIILPSVVSLHSQNDNESYSDNHVTNFNKNKTSEKKSKKMLTKAERKKKKKREKKEKQKALEEEKLYEEKLKVIKERINSLSTKDLFPEFGENKTLRFLRLFHNKDEAKFEPPEKGKSELREDFWYEGWKPEEGREARPEEIMTDDEEILKKPMKVLRSKVEPLEDPSIDEGNHGDQDAVMEGFEWRENPAYMWYCKVEGSGDGKKFNYGFRLRPENYQGKSSSRPEVTDKSVFPSEDHFYMVSQNNWEEDIIWDSDELQKNKNKKIMQSNESDETIHESRVNREEMAGWIPSTNRRNLGRTPGEIISDGENMNAKKKEGVEVVRTDSAFPIDNYNLIYGDWEKDIIWDDQNMDFIPQPQPFKLDPNDPEIILELPEEPKSIRMQAKENAKKEVKKKGGSKNANKENEESSDNLLKKNMFNLSNDYFYESKKTNDGCLSITNTLLQHSTPAMELNQLFFPTDMKQEKWQNFHRQPMKRYSHGPMSRHGPHKVYCAWKNVIKKGKQREQERTKSGGGDVFFMRKVEDLSALDGNIVLAEYSEEFPPLMSQVGMAVKMKNYFKRKPDNKDLEPPVYKFGELAYTHSNSPFLGSLQPGESLQAFECNMFRAPVYNHNVSKTDFLLIRNRHHYYIRQIHKVFTVGQQCPLMEVPGPNSKKATNHIRDFLQVFIYRMFADSPENPKKIRMEDIKKAFPQHSETSIRKRLKACAEFNRTGVDSNWWVLRSTFRLPTEDEMRAMVSPEQACAYYSMASAHKRLVDAGYVDKNMLVQPDDDNDEEQTKVDEEILSAPWHTTRAFMSAVRGKCLLNLTGSADPTGCGEGFAYIKQPMKPVQTKGQQQGNEQQSAPPKKQVTGTDADLRRLNLTAAKKILKEFGVPEEEIRKLSRWEVIDVVRTMSTEHARAGDSAAGKYARGTRYSVAEHQERYKEECQRLFELQNKVLSCRDIQSTDEGSSDEDSDFEDITKSIENSLINNKTEDQLKKEKEEEERKDLLKMMKGEPSQIQNQDKKSDDQKNIQIHSGSCLVITRTHHEDGQVFTREETVRRPEVIQAYIRLKQKEKEDKSIINRYIMQDEHTREEVRREKRRLQEQLRRIKRNQQKEKQNKHNTTYNPNMKCGACGQTGHMRTNRYCPMYKNSTHVHGNEAILSDNSDDERKVAPTVNQTKVDGLKMTIKNVKMHAEEANESKSSLKINIKVPPKNKSNGDDFDEPSTARSKKENRKRKGDQAVIEDYLKGRPQKKDRQRVDPLVALSTLLETILTNLKNMRESEFFRRPVNTRKVADYNNVIENPMDLRTMRNNLNNKVYQSTDDFMEHIELIASNALMYNGADHIITHNANKMKIFVKEQLKLKEDKILRLEKEINPLIDDDDQVAFSNILKEIVAKLYNNKQELAAKFHIPVPRSQTDYYERISEPMDLGTIRKNVKNHKYSDRQLFLKHVELLLRNSIEYYGSDHAYTEIAQWMVDKCRKTIENKSQQIEQLEVGIIARSKIAQDEDMNDMDTNTEFNDENDIMNISLSEDGSTTTMPIDQLIEDNETQSFNQNNMDILGKAMEQMEQNVEHMEGEQTSNNADLFDDLYMSSDEDDQNFNQQEFQTNEENNSEEIIQETGYMQEYETNDYTAEESRYSNNLSESSDNDF